MKRFYKMMFAISFCSIQLLSDINVTVFINSEVKIFLQRYHLKFNILIVNFTLIIILSALFSWEVQFKNLKYSSSVLR